MLVDLVLKDSTVLIIGGGSVGERKALSVSKECPKLIVASKTFTAAMSAMERNGVRLEKLEPGSEDKTLRRLISKADIVIPATSSKVLNSKVSSLARRRGCLVGAVDDPSSSDFYFPAVRTVGTVRVAVSTGGRSPAMARMICKKLAKNVTKEDLLWVELLDHVRRRARRRVKSPRERKALVYEVLESRGIRRLLRSGRLAEAKDAAERMTGLT